MMIKNLLLAGAGGFIGSALRYLLFQTIKPVNLFSTTLLINIVGSLLIGIVISTSIKDSQFSNTWKVFLATGICGGFTTFSAFSLENLQLFQQGKYALSLVYITSSVVLGILACFIGYKITG
jgi:CrcB protein